MAHEVASKGADPVRPLDHDRHVAVWLYAVIVVCLFAAAAIVSGAMHASGFVWLLTLFGALVISVLISGVVVPHLRDHVNRQRPTGR